MEIYIKDRKLKAALEDDALCRRYYGVDMAKKLTQRLSVLRAAETLATFWPPKSGPERCHELVGDLAGIFSMDLKQPYRLLFRPIEDPPEMRDPDQQQRWNSVRSIEILRIEDTHG
ncbi:type II toxin-antitoxin system RelE/ParE family toxin [Sorangium sp. So ce1099]|uniref:type II toxin-antitoxin system RelE/ParE family toxin n=1 Tax=Sorangium sp. So ce1099 TaxID=3133331 RepID=UPI003F6295B0